MPLLGLGVYDMYEQEAVQAVLWALEIGYRLIDTAAMYRNEKDIGQALQQSLIPRQEVFLTTKVNNPDQGYSQTLKSFDTSLNLLKTDYVDLYLVHWPIKATRKETWLALERLYSEGRVKAIGVANYLEPFLAELDSYGSVIPAVDQVEFSPFLYLKDLKELCQSKGIVLQAYTPLARGRRMQDERLQALSKKYDKTPAQIMLRWILQHGVSAIPKSSNQLRLQENFDVFDFEIAAQDMALMNGFHDNYRVVPDPMEYL